MIENNDNQIILQYLRDKVKELNETQKHSGFLEAWHYSNVKGFLRDEIRKIVSIEKLTKS